MSATNETSTIGLSQYISTDKPTYLTDYNGDMLKIDNAIAADREGIASAQNKANTADGKADANKTSIDTLGAQINGDPTDPSDTGLAGKVNAVEGNVNAINALLGNGSPTTSDQTVIGAINNLEDTIAPSEDANTLGANYVTGEKFMRGGKLYEALVDLTSGTAFSALTLNTDYKVADRLATQIGAIKGRVDEFGTHLVPYDIESVLASVTADGVKTYSQLLDELFAAFASFVSSAEDNEYVKFDYLHIDGIGDFAVSYSYVFINSSAIITETFDLNKTYTNGVNLFVAHDVSLKASGSSIKYYSTDGTTSSFDTADSTVPSEGAIIVLKGMTYKLI